MCKYLHSILSYTSSFRQFELLPTHIKTTASAKAISSMIDIARIIMYDLAW